MNLNDNYFNVELHTHLDGSFKAETILNFAKRRNIEIPFKNVEDINKYLRFDRLTLREFLEPFKLIIPIFQGDKEAIWQMSHDFIEQCAASKTCYVETRLCPDGLTSPGLNSDQVIRTILDAFESTKSEFHVEARVIICGLWGCADNMSQLLEIAKNYKSHGVVAIDIAGDEQLLVESGGNDLEFIKIFNEAKRAGIHRTVHAGENGPAEIVREAVYKMHAERIGHGYHVLDDPSLYEDLKKKNIHFEVCPSSSFMTGAVTKDPLQHPILTFYKDNVNYSINCDDTMMTGRNLDSELDFTSRIFNLPKSEIKRTTLNAAKSSFLEDEEKNQLLEHLAKLNII